MPEKGNPDPGSGDLAVLSASYNRMDGRDYSHDATAAMFQKSVVKNRFNALGYVGMTDLMDAMDTDEPDPIKAAVVQGMNPAVITDNQTKVRRALSRVPFLAVFDPLMTPTAQMADLVLPAATYLERDSPMKWWFGSKPRLDGLYLGLQRKAVEPLGECKDGLYIHQGSHLGHGEKGQMAICDYRGSGLTMSLNLF